MKIGQPSEREMERYWWVLLFSASSYSTSCLYYLKHKLFHLEHVTAWDGWLLSNTANPSLNYGQDPTWFTWKYRTTPPTSHPFSFFPHWAPPWLAPDSLHDLAGPEPPNPSSFSNSAAVAVWSMIPLIITATLSPLSHHPNWHGQGQLSADCLHRLGLH